jgi:hypothetical protein
MIGFSIVKTAPRSIGRLRLLVDFFSLCVLAFVFIASTSSNAVEPTEGILPMGDAPAALSAEYFPDRLHEFVWRNWGVITPEALAEVVETTPESLVFIAESMGLPRAPVIQPEMMKRGYLTVIRRNWHLLPYEQLLLLLDLTPERLSVMLREEDFLWVKLGHLKPACSPLRYAAPDEQAKKREAEIRRVVEQDFGEELNRPAAPRFDFVRQFEAPPQGFSPTPTTTPTKQLRIVYSYTAVYGDPLLNTELNPYPDGLLARLSASGVNGVWLQGLLRDLAPGGEAFPEFGVGAEERLANLRALTERAKKYGVGVYLYINEPRAMPAKFFADSENETRNPKRSEIAGAKETELTALCTSQPAVRKWMGDALAHIFRQVPELAGVYAITASENLTNCFSHGDPGGCPRCKERNDVEVIAEVVGVIEEGVHRGNPNATALISDWGWRGHGDAREIIARLPKSITLMSVSEWSLPIERGGIKSTVGEYSISAVGPGPRARQHWDTAATAGLKCGTEIQFNNTCEIASVPYIPAMNLVAEHCRNLRDSTKLDAMLIGWTMGGCPSPNFELAARMFDGNPETDMNSTLDSLASERFGAEGGPVARKAWTDISEAFREYPFHIGVVYTSPVQCGPANPLYAAKTGYKATMWGIPYDDLDGWRGPYPPETFAAQFEKVGKGFAEGAEELKEAASKAPSEKQEAARADSRLAEAESINFLSVANQTRFVMARDALNDASNALSTEERAQRRENIRELLESEINLSRRLFVLTGQDSRIGYEPSCQYFYLRSDLVEKVINCRWLMERFAEPGS